MKIRVEFIQENDKPEDQKSLGVALHARRGDTMNVEQSRTIGEGDVLVIEMPSNGQVLLMGPDNKSNIVYDRATMANSIKEPDARLGFVDKESKIAERKKFDPIMKPETDPMDTKPPLPPVGTQTPAPNADDKPPGSTTVTNAPPASTGDGKVIRA